MTGDGPKVLWGAIGIDSLLKINVINAIVLSAGKSGSSMDKKSSSKCKKCDIP
jgi:hypothetical protein